MSLQAYWFRHNAGKNDKKRDSAIALPEGITECRNISYGCHGESNLLDVYYPDAATGALPTIVSIHGGGYVYGSKEVYRRYGMDMAKRGFAFVNFNYRLAPKWKFPTPLADTNAVLEWVEKNCVRYHLDPHRIILVGDSAGAQLASQYAAIAANPEYCARFDMKLPRITIKALGLFCGMYDAAALAAQPRKGLHRDYLGKDLSPADPRVQVLAHIGEKYPPVFLATSHCDFLKDCAQPLFDFLTDKGIPCRYHCYGAPEKEEVGHVFHVNIRLTEAVQCNDDAAAFFREYV